MKFKHKIVLIYSLLVTAMLLFLCITIYFLSESNRQNDFRKRLRNRALTTMSLLIKVPEMNKNLLRRIDELTLIALQQRSTIVYDQDGNIFYQYTQENSNAFLLNEDIKEKVNKNGEYYFSIKNIEAVALLYFAKDNTYLVINAAKDLDGIDKINQLKIILFFSFISSVLITIISGFFFSNNLVVPIKKIIAEVNEISSLSLSKRIIAPKPKDELNELATTFNELLNRLQKSFESQKRFIANASHELSTPLTSILSQLEISLQKERNVVEYKKVILSVCEDVINLTQLTKALLEIAKARGSISGIEFSLFRVDEMLLKLPHAIKQYDVEYKVFLHFDAYPNVEEKLLVFGNVDLLFSAIKNVVQNGCKYSQDHITNIFLHFQSNDFEIVIADNGPGIKEEDIPHIFEPFYRGSSSRYNLGFGLGLSLAHEIIDIHKGSISVINKPKVGSQFAITIPIANSFHAM